MDCKAVQQVIFRFIYGECDSYTLQKVKEHLDVCGACRRERDIIQEILTKLKDGLVEEPVPESFRQRVMARVHAIEADPEF